jgi:serine/threonine protein kinase
VIDRRRFSSRGDEDEALKEVDILTTLQSCRSERRVRILQVTEDVHQFYIVMNFMERGNLGSLLSRERLNERQVQRLTRSLLEGIQELHDLSIAHLDLEPENILLNNEAEAVLCDFGCATYVKSGSSTRGKRYGNLSYAAPEVVLNRSRGLAADMWSVGVILYSCLSGKLPFEDPSRVGLKEKIAKAEYDFGGIEWHFVSRGAKQFLSALLHADPNVRMTVSEALAHPWLTLPPRMLVPKRTRRSLVQRIWGRIARPSSKDQHPLFATSTLSSIDSIEKESTKRRKHERRHLSM